MRHRKSFRGGGWTRGPHFASRENSGTDDGELKSPRHGFRLACAEDYQVRRGGSYFQGHPYVGARIVDEPGNNMGKIGFRLVREGT